MSVDNAAAPRVSVQYGDLAVYLNAGVSDDVSMSLHMREADDETVSILFGKERITLEFYDVESLERLRELAEEGARRLRAAIELNKRAADAAAAAVARPGASAVGGVR